MEGAGALTGQKQRDFMIDNFKGIMIILVVVAHFSHHFTGDYKPVIYMRNLIYFMNMPAFAFISGYLFKGNVKIGKLIKGLVIPYTVFQIFYWSLYSMMGLAPKFSMLEPFFSLWYLPALLIWKLVLSALKEYKRFLLVFFLGFGIVAGYIVFDENMLSLQRVISFFPFFIVGYSLDKERYAAFKLHKKRAIGFTVSILGLAYYLGSAQRKIFDIDLLNCDTSYFEMHMVTDGWFYRLCFYAISIALVLVLGSVISSNKTIFTNIGRNSMRVYLLHGLIYRYLIYDGRWIFDLVTNPALLVLYYVVIVAMCFALSKVPVERLFQRIYDAGYHMIFAQNPQWAHISHTKA